MRPHQHCVAFEYVAASPVRVVEHGALRSAVRRVCHDEATALLCFEAAQHHVRRQVVLFARDQKVRSLGARDAPALGGTHLIRGYKVPN